MSDFLSSSSSRLTQQQNCPNSKQAYLAFAPPPLNPWHSLAGLPRPLRERGDLPLAARLLHIYLSPFPSSPCPPQPIPSTHNNFVGHSSLSVSLPIQISYFCGSTPTLLFEPSGSSSSVSHLNKPRPHPAQLPGRRFSPPPFPSPASP